MRKACIRARGGGAGRARPGRILAPGAGPANGRGERGFKRGKTMRNDNLAGLRVAVVAADGFEQVELTSPVDELEEQGARVEIVSVHPGRIRGMNHMHPGRKVRVDRTIDDVTVDDFDALLLPGGMINPDTLRQDPRVLDFVADFNAAGKPIAMICHAPWVMVSGGAVAGRQLTSWPGIRHDVINAGGLWTDEPVVRDRNWVTSRGPDDLPFFNRAIAELFAEHLPMRVEYEGEEEGGGVVRAVVAGLAAAGLGYALWSYLRADRTPAPRSAADQLGMPLPIVARPEPVETVEAVTTVEPRVVIEEVIVR